MTHDLIRREDALAIVTNGHAIWPDIVAAIRALPAMRVKSLEWTDFYDGKLLEVRPFGGVKAEIFVNVNSVTLYDGYSKGREFPTVKAAKAAAQADHEARIWGELEGGAA